MPLQVDVKLIATLRRYLPPGARGNACRLEAQPGTSVMELLGQLGVPDLESHVILVNGRDAEASQILQEGDVIAVFPAMAGG